MMKRVLSIIVSFMLVFNMMSVRIIGSESSLITDDIVSLEEEKETLDEVLEIENEELEEVELEILNLEAERIASERLNKAMESYEFIMKASSCEPISRSLNLNQDEEFYTVFNQGRGTESEPYLVRNYEQLKLLVSKVDAGFDFTNVHFKQTKNISLEERDGNNNLVPWTPIGSMGKSFSGVFDGNQHKLSDLYIDTDNQSQGFFGLTLGATIKNVVVSSEAFRSGGYSGTLIGMAIETDIINCHVISDVRSNVEYIGGVIGYTGNSKISNCTFRGSVTTNSEMAGGITGCLVSSNIEFSTNYGSVHGKQYIGGMIGQALMTNKSELKSCKNKGYIQGGSTVGGLVGEVINNRSDSVNFIMKESYNEGGVEAESVVGGLTGSVSGNLTILYCYNTAQVQATDAGMAGGIVGKYNQYLSATASVFMCYNTGNIIAAGGFKGGIVGYNNAIVMKCFLLGNGVLGIGGGPNLSGAKILTPDALKTLGGEIREPFIMDTDMVNSGYPIINSIQYIEEDRGGSTFRYSSETERDYESTYYYTDDYFSKSSYEYDQSLATMTLCFAMSAFASNDEKSYENKSVNARQLLEDIGFSGIRTNEGYKVKPSKDSIGVIAGYKTIDVSGKEYTLIALAVRGAGYGSEWASNFTMGETGEHEGFSGAKDEVLVFLNDYVNNAHITGDVKLWITGYSRAAATVNLTAGALDSGILIDNCSLELSDLYAYCFETPAGAVWEEVKNKAIYKNIFNIVNPNDPVPKLAPAFFGFGRYGIDKVLLTEIDGSDYLPAKSKMLQRFHKLESTTEYVVDDFSMKKISPVLTIIPTDPIASGFSVKIIDDKNNQISQSRFLDQLIISITKEVFKTRLHYVAKYQEVIRETCGIAFDTEEEQWTNFNKLYKDKINSKMDELILEDPDTIPSIRTDVLYQLTVESLNEAGITDYSENQIYNLTSTIGIMIFELAANHPNLAATAVANGDELAKAHYPELCLSWMQSMDKNYSNDAKVSFTSGSYRIARINCPVDVEVYDSTNTLVAEIKSDEPQTIEDSGMISTVNPDGEKLVYLPAEADYSIKLKATADGRMTYSINEFSFQIGDISRITNYYDINLQIGDTFTGNIPAYSEADFEKGTGEGSASNYVLTQADREITSDIDLKGKDASEAYYMVYASAEEEKQLLITGQGIRQLGNYAQLTAYPLEGYTFAGWYIDDNKVSEESEYRFRVESDTIVVAKAIKTPPKTEGTFGEFFPDPNFAQAVAEHFGKNASDLTTIDELQSLKVLNAKAKKITNIDGIGRLSSLEKMILSSNFRSAVNANTLTVLPDEICLLNNLNYLELSYNHLEKLPDRIGDLSNLTDLMINNQEYRSPINNALIGESKLTTLPESLWNLKKLYYLNVSGNPIGNLPETIEGLSNLDSLNINATGATKLPNSLATLINLRFIYIESNDIEHIPDGFENLKNLYGLQMAKNRFSRLSEGLMSILVNNTGLKVGNTSTGGQRAILENKTFLSGSEMTVEEILPPIILQLNLLNNPRKTVQGSFIVKDLTTGEQIKQISLTDLLQGIYPLEDFKPAVGQYKIEIIGGSGWIDRSRYEYTMEVID